VNYALLRIYMLGTALSVVLLSTLDAKASPLRKKNPTSKMYVADTEGEAEINTGEKIESLTKKSVHNAEGTSIETKKDSPTAMVFSNGTGLFLDPDTKLDVKKFAQEPFKPNRSDMNVEPSISQTSSSLARGSASLCSSKLVAGSTMTYASSHGSVAIRGGKVSMETNDQQTTVSLIEGDVTVRGGNMDTGGQVLKPGQQAIITPGPVGGASTVKIQDIPPAQLPALEKKVTAACMAKSTVYFETASRLNTNGGTGGTDSSESPFVEQQADEIVTVPLAPVDIPNDHGKGLAPD
jgi:FecR protein